MVVVVGAAVAQTEGAAEPPAVDVTVPERSTLSAEDMMKQATEYRTSMDQVLAKIETMVAEARKDKDVIRLNCLNDKVVQGRANLNVADTAMTGLKDAMASNDEGARLYEYTRVTIVNQKMQVLAAEAEACVGEELGFVGPTKVDVDVDPDLRGDDPTAPATGPLADVMRPPSTRPVPPSPFR